MSDKTATYREEIPLQSGDRALSLLRGLAERAQSAWQTVVVFIPYAWLLLFFLAPFFIVLKISLAESMIASPPSISGH